jgi:hypothetical protein
MSKCIDPAHFCQTLDPTVLSEVERWHLLIDSTAPGVCVAKKNGRTSTPATGNIEH